MLLAAFIILIVLLIVAVLFVPIAFYIDTDSEQYYIKFGALAKAIIEPHKTEIIAIRIKMPFFQYYVYPFQAKKKSKKKVSLAKHKKLKKGTTYVEKFKIVRRLLRSFKVKRFLLDIDTGDCISNAKLYPVFALLDYKMGGFKVNFEGRNRLALHITNRPIYIIKSFINL